MGRLAELWRNRARTEILAGLVSLLDVRSLRADGATRDGHLVHGCVLSQLRFGALELGADLVPVAVGSVEVNGALFELLA